MSIENKLVTIAENMKAIYDAGCQEGEGIMWSEFWDKYQENGNRKNYQNLFSGSGWTEDTFKPKYNINPQNIINMFAYSTIDNLAEILENLGIVIDFSYSKGNASQTFAYSTIKQIPRCDFSNLSSMGLMFYNSSVEKIEELIMPTNGGKIDRNFNGCENLKEITISGEIKQNGFDIHWSVDLSKESYLSILNALADKKEDTSASWVVTLPTTAQEVLTEDEILIATNKNWQIEYQ